MAIEHNTDISTIPPIALPWMKRWEHIRDEIDLTERLSVLNTLQTRELYEVIGREDAYAFSRDNAILIAKYLKEFIRKNENG